MASDLARDLRRSERRLARAELVADDAVDVEPGRGQDDARRVARRIGLADDEDRVGRLVGIEAVRGAEGGRVGKRRVAREELVRDSQRVEPLGQSVAGRVGSHSPKDTDRDSYGRRGVSVPAVSVDQWFALWQTGFRNGRRRLAGGDSLPGGTDPAFEFRLLAGRDVDHREILSKIADDLGAVR